MKNWECFCDVSYYGLWSVRPVGENRWGHCFHVQTQKEAEGLRDLLNDLCGGADTPEQARCGCGITCPTKYCPHCGKLTKGRL